MPAWFWTLALLNLALLVLASSVLGYAIARLRWRGRGLLFVIAAVVLCGEVWIIPQAISRLALHSNTILSPLCFADWLGSILGIFLFCQLWRNVPRDFEDAARVDGCGFLRIYWHVILPLVRPILVAVAIVTFLATWNQSLAPVVYLVDQRLYLLSYDLHIFPTPVADPGAHSGMVLLIAGSFFMTLPVIAIFFFAKRYFLQGRTLTGLEG
ncbi:MAG TPA: ABC transporter permease subunit [Chthoniobacterales bacterium]|nr:ABC transporter permease subunit [Chthoniobacterales bacterium]